MKGMKAYKVFDRKGYSPYSIIVFAETRGKAISSAIGTDEYPKYEWDYTQLKAVREPALDKYYRGRIFMDWDNMEDRVAMVKEAGYQCEDEYADIDDCKNCEAKEYCEEYERLQEMQTEWDEYDRCYECRGLGDDYRVEGEEMVCNCDTCPFNHYIPGRR